MMEEGSDDEDYVYVGTPFDPLPDDLAGQTAARRAKIRDQNLPVCICD